MRYEVLSRVKVAGKLREIGDTVTDTDIEPEVLAKLVSDGTLGDPNRPKADGVTITQATVDRAGKELGERHEALERRAAELDARERSASDLEAELRGRQDYLERGATELSRRAIDADAREKAVADREAKVKAAEDAAAAGGNTKKK